MCMTAKAGNPKPWDITTLAVLWPTPGNFSSSSNVLGTLPLCFLKLVSTSDRYFLL